MKIERFEEIESWKAARELTNEIYKMCSIGYFAKDYISKDEFENVYKRTTRIKSLLIGLIRYIKSSPN